MLSCRCHCANNEVYWFGWFVFLYLWISLRMLFLRQLYIWSIWYSVNEIVDWDKIHIKLLVNEKSKQLIMSFLSLEWKQKIASWDWNKSNPLLLSAHRGVVIVGSMTGEHSFNRHRWKSTIVSDLRGEFYQVLASSLLQPVGIRELCNWPAWKIIFGIEVCLFPIERITHPSAIPVTARLSLRKARQSQW